MQLLLLDRWIVRRFHIHSIILIKYWYFWEMCVSYGITPIVLVIYVCRLLWWVYRYLCLVLILMVLVCMLRVSWPIIPFSLVVLLIELCLLLPCPLCLSKMYRWHFRDVGALHVFWAISKKLVQLGQQLFSWLHHFQHHFYIWVLLPVYNQQITFVGDVGHMFLVSLIIN